MRDDAKLLFVGAFVGATLAMPVYMPVAQSAGYRQGHARGVVHGRNLQWCESRGGRWSDGKRCEIAEERVDGLERKFKELHEVVNTNAIRYGGLTL